MGLREAKAARTRAHLIDVAVTLFAEQGYEETTMEQIAARAEVGSSTLYRYFASKELLLLDPFTRSGALVDALRARPPEEPIDLALGIAISEALGAISDTEPHLDAVRAVIDRSPGPRARLWDLLAQERALLEEAVAERLERERSELSVVLTTRLALLVVELAADTWRAGDHRTSLGQTAVDILTRLDTEHITPPRLPELRD